MVKSMRVKQKIDGTIVIDQTHYIKTLEEPKVNTSLRRRRDDPLNEEEKKELKSFAGQLAWAANTCHPEVCFDARMLAQSIECSTVSDVLYGGKILRKLKNDSRVIRFVPLQDIKDWKLVVYSDASFVKKDGRESQEGHLIFLVDKKGNSNILRWCSKKISRVVHSTISAEVIAAKNAMETTYYYKKFIERKRKS